jgi:hypothetical protein
MSTQTESALERKVREEQEAHEATLAAMDDAELEPDVDPESNPDDGPIVDEATGQTAIVDRSQYEREDLQIPKIDGQTIDQIAMKVSGRIVLDRSDPSDVAVYNEITLGREVTLLVEAKCVATGATGATNREGDLDVVIGIKGIKVHSLRKPAGADWVQDAA